MIQQMQVEQACHSGNASAVQHENVRNALAQAKGKELELGFGGVALAGFVMRTGGNEVHFSYEWKRDAVPQLRCWSPAGELE